MLQFRWQTSCPHHLQCTLTPHSPMWGPFKTGGATVYSPEAPSRPPQATMLYIHTLKAGDSTVSWLKRS